MVLAAGRGERMRPLTDTAPKPMLAVQGKPLLHWHLTALAQGGVRHAVVNTAWLGHQIPAQTGFEWNGLHLSYSMEGQDFGNALETAGGIARALPLLDEVFWVAAGDVFVPGFVYDPAALNRFSNSAMLAHLWLVPNPVHHPTGDFGLSAQGLALNLPQQSGMQRYTYSTIGLYRRKFFEQPLCDIPLGNPQGTRAALGPMLRRAMDAGQVSAEIYPGPWTDVGTPERLAQLNAEPHPSGSGV
ncbi:MAG: hypothetical protein RL323_488 [Pseudomonadota bacterium]